MDDKEYEAYYRRVAEMETLDIADVSKLVNVDFVGLDFGSIREAAISIFPEEFIEGTYFSSDGCPLCFDPLDESGQIAANLTIKFEMIPSGIGYIVWMHRSCFEDLA